MNHFLDGEMKRTQNVTSAQQNTITCSPHKKLTVGEIMTPRRPEGDGSFLKGTAVVDWRRRMSWAVLPDQRQVHSLMNGGAWSASADGQQMEPLAP